MAAASVVAASRLEARLALEAAVEIRYPRLLVKKPIAGSLPLDMYALHQTVLRFGGYRKVESSGLWERILDELASPSTPTCCVGAFSVSDTSHVKYQVRERILRHLAWIEDDAPPARVATLAAAARFEDVPLTLTSSSLSLPSGKNLLGGGVNELHPWLHGYYHYDAFNDQTNLTSMASSASSSAPTAVAIGAEAHGMEDGAPSPLAADTPTGTDAAAPAPPLLMEVDGRDTPTATSATATAGVKRARSDAGAAVTAGGKKTPRMAAGSTSAAGLADVPLPHYMRPLPVPFGWETDADRLYRIHDCDAQTWGAIACHMPPNEMMDDEAAAFPHFSRVAHINTTYAEASRKDVLRAGPYYYVIPTAGEVVIDPDDEQARLDGITLQAAPTMDAADPMVNALNRVRPLRLRSMQAFFVPSEAEVPPNALGAQLLHSTVGSKPPLAPVWRYHIDRDEYMRVAFPTGVDAVLAMTPEGRRRFTRTEPLAGRMLDRQVEQEPWVGGSAGRMQFYLDVRNHILLKWMQSQDVQHPRNAYLRACVAPASIVAAVPSSPSHHAWNGSAKYTGPAAAYMDVDAYDHPCPLTLAEVTSTLPPRYHEVAAAVFDFLESRGRINVGALDLRALLLPAPRAAGTPAPPVSTVVDNCTLPAALVRTRVHPDRRRKVLVQGAGMSGLAVARQMLFFGHDVQVIEARGRPGGRICTNRDTLGIPVDEGAMISTGDEPNPFALLSRQLRLRMHRINNTQVPLLLPRRFHRRVAEIAIAREYRNVALEMWTTRQQAHLTSLLQQRKLSTHNLAEATASATAPASSETLYNPLGRSVFGVNIPPELSYLSNEVVKHAIRIATGHMALMHSHMHLLRRIYKCLTVAAMGFTHDPSVHDSYGVLHQARPLSPRVSAQLQMVFDEMVAVRSIITRSQASYSIDIMRQLVSRKYGGQEKQAGSPAVEDVSMDGSAAAVTGSTALTSTAAMIAKLLSPASTGGAEPTDDDADAPWVVALPANLDAEIDTLFNELLEETNTLRAGTFAPALMGAEPADAVTSTDGMPEDAEVPPLLAPPSGARGPLVSLTSCHDAPAARSRVVAAQGGRRSWRLPAEPLLPPGWVLNGHEVMPVTQVQMSRTASTVVLSHMAGMRYNFKYSADGGVVGEGVVGWSLDVVPRNVPIKFADPRRTEYDLANSYEVAYSDPNLAPSMNAAIAAMDRANKPYNSTSMSVGGSASDRQALNTHGQGAPVGSAARRGRRAATSTSSPTSRGSTVVTSHTSSASTMTPTLIKYGKGPNETSYVLPPKPLFFGVRPLWDMSLGYALEMAYAQDIQQEHELGENADVHRAAMDAAQNAVVACGGLSMMTTGRPGITSIRDPREPHSIAAAVAAAVASGVPSLNAADQLLQPARVDVSQSTAPSALTYSDLTSSVLRWHAANLEYGCARSVMNVSLQSWDQDDIHSYHDRGQHSFAKDGYDTFVRGMVAGLPVMYDCEVAAVRWQPNTAMTAGTEWRNRVQLDVRNTTTAAVSTVPGDIIVVTASVGVLQSGAIDFQPALPEWKTSAVNAVGMGLLNKVILRFPRAFWRQQQASGSAGSGSGDAQATPKSAAAPVGVQPAPLGAGDSHVASLLATFGWTANGNNQQSSVASGSTSPSLDGAVVAARSRSRKVTLVPPTVPASAYTATSVYAPLATALPSSFPSQAAAVNMMNLVANAAQTVGAQRTSETARRNVLERATEALRAVAEFDADPSDSARKTALEAVEAARVAAMHPDFAVFEWTRPDLRKMPMPINTYLTDGWINLLRTNHYRVFPETAVVPRTIAPHRVASFIPFMNAFNNLHLLVEPLSDADILKACSLAIGSAALVDRATGASSPLLSVAQATDVFVALAAIGEARGDVDSAAKTIMEWFSDSAESDAPTTEAGFFSELVRRTPASMLPVYRWAADYSQSVFIVPDVTPPPVVSPPLTDAPATPARADTPAAREAPPPSPASGIVPPAPVVPIIVPPERVAVKMPSLQPRDDAFCHVGINDNTAPPYTRGQAYMFWCCDGPSRGATIRLQPASGEEATPMEVDGEDACEPVLIAMMAGDAAEWVESATDSEVLSSVMASLRSLFGSAAVPEPVSHIITRWRSDKYARGSYSFLPPTSQPVHYDLMALPVEDTVFFAGEATNRQHPTTAAGAFDSGVREAVRLAGMYGRSHDANAARILTRRRTRVVGTKGTCVPATITMAHPLGVVPASSGVQKVTLVMGPTSGAAAARVTAAAPAALNPVVSAGAITVTAAPAVLAQPM